MSTKVGRLLEPNPRYDGGRDLANGFDVPDDLVRRFDPTLAGVRRSLEDSLERMGLERIDILFLHDPDAYDLDWGLREGLPALAQLRDEGLVDAIGVGVNDSAVATRAVLEGDLDVVMIAGRYTLLEQTAAADLLPACAARGVTVVDAAIFNSGLLATPDPRAATPATTTAMRRPTSWRARASSRAVCAEFGVELPTAAHPVPAAASARLDGRHGHGQPGLRRSRTSTAPLSPFPTSCGPRSPSAGSSTTRVLGAAGKLPLSVRAGASAAQCVSPRP